MKALPTREGICSWFYQQVTGEVDSLYIPENQANAFLGTLVGYSNPSIAVLDYEQVFANLVGTGLTNAQAQHYILKQVSERKGQMPVICKMYPNIHPDHLK